MSYYHVYTADIRGSKSCERFATYLQATKFYEKRKADNHFVFVQLVRVAESVMEQKGEEK